MALNALSLKKLCSHCRFVITLGRLLYEIKNASQTFSLFSFISNANSLVVMLRCFEQFTFDNLYIGKIVVCLYKAEQLLVLCR